MKQFGVVALLILTCVFLPGGWKAACGQSGGYTVVSKRCVACGKPVSINSRIGQRCPHCGVIWGEETSTYTTRPRTRYIVSASSYTTRPRHKTHRRKHAAPKHRIRKQR